MRAKHGTTGLYRNADPTHTLWEGNTVHMPEGALALVIDAYVRPTGPDSLLKQLDIVYLLIDEKLVEAVSEHFEVVCRNLG